MAAKRKQLFVDTKVQLALLWRVVMYWVFALMTVTLMLLCWCIIKGPDQVQVDAMRFYYTPALAASLIMLPIVIIDIIKLSNKFVGPLVRLRRALKMVANGEKVAPIYFREGDFWQDIATEFNAVVARIDADAEENAKNEQGAPSDSGVATSV